MSIGTGPPTPKLSPDGKWIWDGKQWLPVKGASPPPRPPQMSPDGRWVWDGKQWLPVARREAVFPAFDVVPVEQEPAAQPARAAEREPIPVIGEEPEADPAAYAYPQVAESSTPAWERAQTGLNKYLYVGAGVVVLIIAALWINSIGPLDLPWVPSTPVKVKPTPTPEITARTDSAAADHYLNVLLGPSLTALGDSGSLTNEVCNGLLTTSCHDHIIDTDNHIKAVLSVMNRLNAPPRCIEAPVARLKIDLVNMDKGLQLALQGYTDNKASELGLGIAQFYSAGVAETADGGAAQSASKSSCSNELTGP